MSGKYALIIGNTEYADSALAQLNAPSKDAEDLARVLRDPNICAFNDVKILMNEPSAFVIEKIDEFFDQRKIDDLLVLYFSGHGIRDELGSLYLAFKNTIRARLRSTAIKSDYIREAMDQSRSKRQVVILDCCNSGAFPQGTKAEAGGAMGMIAALQGYGRFVLTASDATQFAWEGDKVIGKTKNSLFTHFLVKGLEGEADRNSDGRITVDELYDYAFDEIIKLTPKQTPTKSISKQEGEIVLRQMTHIEDIKPVALPEDLVSEIEDLRPYVREVAVQKLEKIVKGTNIGLARSAKEALEKIEKEDDSRRVSRAAKQVLDSIQQEPKPIPSKGGQNPILRWAVIGVIGIMVIAASIWGISNIPRPGNTPTPEKTATQPSPTNTHIANTKAPFSSQAPSATEPIQSIEPVTISWWHITTVDPGLSDWQKMADDYMADHPNVTIEITVLGNDVFKAKLNAAMQSGDPPDIFQSWGGGTFNQQAQAGLLKDITPDLNANDGEWRNTFAPGALRVYAYEDKNYGVPWDMGMVGWWYNKALFKQAEIENPPTTWTEFLDDVRMLKNAGITPIALGEGDKWPGMHIWSYLAIRICGQKGFEAAINRTGSFTDPCFIEAGKKLQELIALRPFQKNYLSARHDDMQTAFGDGKAAMELSGQWAPSLQKSSSANQNGIGENLGLFNFPAVEGGAGNVTDVIGGGNGFVIGKNAEPEVIDFVKYLTSKENQIIIARHDLGIPVVKGGEQGLSDVNMFLVQQSFINAKYFQLYYDQYLPPSTGSVLNDAIQGIFAGTLTPEQAAQKIEDSFTQAQN